MKLIKNIAIIPARGGSKRIPRKNIKNFVGKPILAYSIEAAINSEIFDEIMVSTDDGGIAKVATTHGATAPFIRSETNADDFATLSDVLIEVVENYAKTGVEIENICCILPTAPFLTAKTIKKSYTQFIENNYDSLYPVVEFSYPIQRSLVRNEEGIIKMAQSKYLRTRSQDLEKHYHDCGQFYWIKKECLVELKSLMTTNTGMIELTQLEVQDIDTPADWKNAELKYRILNEK